MESWQPHFLNTDVLGISLGVFVRSPCCTFEILGHRSRIFSGESTELLDSCLSSLYIHQKSQSPDLLPLMYEPVVSLPCLLVPGGFAKETRTSSEGASHWIWSFKSIYINFNCKLIFFLNVREKHIAEANTAVSTAGKSTGHWFSVHVLNISKGC